MKSNKTWTVGVLIITLSLLLLVGVTTVFADPFFHYRKPIDGVSYILNDQRYQNNGIVRHFNYNALITGTSMTENFKTSELDELFGVNSIKVSYSGASYKEINDNLKVAFENNNDIKLVVRALDYGKILDTKDTMNYDVSGLAYLYDDILYNDVKYVLNKTVFFEGTLAVIGNSLKGVEPTTFDEYSNWNDEYVFGKESVMAGYIRPEKANTKQVLSDLDVSNIRENIGENVIAIAKENPDVEFYYFITPYSICYWDSINQTGQIERWLEAEKLVIELILEQENIHLFSFLDEYEMVCNLENYKDMAHYGEDINSQILQWMKIGEHQLTKDNYIEYCDANREFYLSYDYNTLFLND